MQYHSWQTRDHGRVAVPRMTDRVYLSDDGRSGYHTCGPTPVSAVIDRYFVKHHLHWTPPLIFTARRVCIARSRPSQNVSVRLSVACDAGILPKWLNISSNFFHRRVATPFLFFRTKQYGFNPPTRMLNAKGYKNRDFSTNIYISKTIRDRAIVTMEGEYRKRTYSSFRLVLSPITLSDP